MRLSRIALLCSIALIFIIPILVPNVYASIPIIQHNCATSFVANGTNVTTTFSNTWTSADIGNYVIVTVTIQGSGITTINSVNVTDNENPTHYNQIARTVDQGNSLFVGVYNQTITTPNPGVFPQISTIMINTPNNNQNLQLCAYEINLPANDRKVVHSTSAGGSNVTMTGTLGDITFAGYAANGGAGGGACASFTLTPAFAGTIVQDVGSPSPCNWVIGRITNANRQNAGTFKGLSNPSFTEELDASFGNTTTVTSTVTGWLIPNFANSAQQPTTISWFELIIIIFLPIGMTDIVLFMGGQLTSRVFTFFMLLGLALGATFGSMVTLTPVALIPVFWGIFIIYIWRFRG